VRPAAIKLAQEISESAPLAVQETRATVRKGLADAVKAATDHELVIQSQLRKTEDFREGIKAYSERRPANFKAR
jgi:enoyl-CoA hydratase/carnithine racemase